MSSLFPNYQGIIFRHSSVHLFKTYSAYEDDVHTLQAASDGIGKDEEKNINILHRFLNYSTSKDGGVLILKTDIQTPEWNLLLRQTISKFFELKNIGSMFRASEITLSFAIVFEHVNNKPCRLRDLR